MRNAIFHRTVILAFAFLLAGCARSVQIGSDPGGGYAVEIQNTLTQDMIVSYDDGSGARTLGTVRAGASERFIITAPARQNITITGQEASGDRSAGPFNVQLVAGETSRVSLR